MIGQVRLGCVRLEKERERERERESQVRIGQDKSG